MKQQILETEVLVKRMRATKQQLVKVANRLRWTLRRSSTRRSSRAWKGYRASRSAISSRMSRSCSESIRKQTSLVYSQQL
ncbi:unnamed protein product [Heligmosomoides polygyrus]|uniref:Uncharacterized protein n=1 Tax=Heligmosomoides polygyrus TaxID=6339 RepID=A0A183F906_HELPZ|nr:unnamed protein product [Heligmosomoides polygyrus]